MGDALIFIFDMFSDINTIFKETTFTAFDFTFSLWDFFVAFLIIDVVIGLVLVVAPRRLASTLPSSSVSERTISELDDMDATDKMLEKGFFF